MTNTDVKDTLTETIAICDVRYQRMSFALQSISRFFPLTKDGLTLLSALDTALFDQLIYRFSKLQDSMGSRLFKQLLQCMVEDTENIPCIDILHKMEKLALLERAQDWIELRQVRNVVSHEYPFYMEVQLSELNLLPAAVEKISSIWLCLREKAIFFCKS